MAPFPKIRGVIGVVHLPPLPGDPLHDGVQSFLDVETFALRDAEALTKGGVDAILVENFGSAPFAKGTHGSRLAPHGVATLAIVAREIARTTSLPVGVNCLRNDAISSLGIAAAAGLSFIRVNVHVGAYVTDQGVIEGEADRSLRYRAALGARSVAILADVLVKHAAPLAHVDATRATHDTLHRGLADAVVVTGEATGISVDVSRLRAVHDAAGDAPVFIGSGLTPHSAARLCSLADGAIVGTYVKERGDVRERVDESRVRMLVEATRGQWRS